jgi:small multidrug resistance pump
MMDKTFLVTESWFSLMAAIIFGVLGTISMKLSHCFHRLKPTLAMGFFYAISFVAMTFALNTIEISVIYGLWSGVGTILVMLLSVVLFKEKLSLKKIFFLLLIIIGIIGIQLTDGSYPFTN